MPKPQVPASLTVDFSNVEERREGGGKAAHVPAGDYLMQVIGVEKKHKKGEETGPGYLNWKTAIVKPAKYANAGNVWHITTLKEEGLWSLRNFIEDLGIKVPKSSVKLPLAQIVEKKLMFGATIDDDEPYNDKIKSKIFATFKKADYEDTGEVDDDDDDSTGATATTDDDDDTEEAVVEEDEDLEELDVDDL